MLTYRTGKLNKKEEQIIRILLEEIPDLFRDFYITKSNVRYFLRENSDLLFEALKSGDKIIYGEEGIAFITGWSDHSKRNYIKILSKDEKSTSNLLKIVNWHVKSELWAKVKKNNTLFNVLKRNNFIFAGSRGKEILLVKKERTNA